MGAPNPAGTPSATTSMTAPTEATTDGHPVRDTLIVGGYTVAALAGPEAGPIARSLYGLFLGTTPVTMPIIGGAIEGLTPGPSGTLTISSATRLTAQEISAGTRYASQTGKALAESAH